MAFCNCYKTLLCIIDGNGWTADYYLLHWNYCKIVADIKVLIDEGANTILDGGKSKAVPQVALVMSCHEKMFIQQMLFIVTRVTVIATIMRD